jgi:hypothetical protein
MITNLLYYDALSNVYHDERAFVLWNIAEIITKHKGKLAAQMFINTYLYGRYATRQLMTHDEISLCFVWPNIHKDYIIAIIHCEVYRTRIEIGTEYMSNPDDFIVDLWEFQRNEFNKRYNK